ncbi:Neprilysin-2 [Nymphon striatum]|nr:Neprilysin-2 [Nymphon striatum]
MQPVSRQVCCKKILYELIVIKLVSLERALKAVHYGSEKKNLNRLNEILKTFGGFPALQTTQKYQTYENVVEKLRKLGAGYSGVFILDVTVDSTDSSRNLLEIQDGELLMPTRKAYIEKGKDINAYRNLLVSVAMLLQDKHVTRKEIEREVDAVIEFETEMAKARYESGADYWNPKKTNNKMNLKTLQSLAPSINWKSHLNALTGQNIREDEIIINVKNPQYVNKMANVIQDTPLSLAPSINWKSHLNAFTGQNILEDEMIINVKNPQYVKKNGKCHSRHSIKNPFVFITKSRQVSIMWLMSIFGKLACGTDANLVVKGQLTQNFDHVLTEEIDEHIFEKCFITSGKKSNKLKDRICFDHVVPAYDKSCMVPAVSSIYLKNYFPEKNDKMVVEMLSNYRSTYKEILKRQSWMDISTKRDAINKLDSMRFFMYPEELKNIKILNDLCSKVSNDSVHKYLDSDNQQAFRHDLTKSNIVKFKSMLFNTYPYSVKVGDNFMSNFLSVEKDKENRKFTQLRKSSEEGMWLLKADTKSVNAFYSPSFNAILLNAGILQDVYFQSNRPMSMNYGGIGWIIGHEISHGFDVNGRKFGRNGNLHEWWSDGTLSRYNKKVDCFKEEFGKYNYPLLGDTKLNAHATIAEILADAAGVMSSYEVFTSKSKGMSKSAPKIFGDFTDRQLYWIAYAQSQCSKATKQERARSQLEDAHPPSQIRINGIVKHSEQFQLDFNCRSCDDMNAKKKCSLWT